MRTGPALVLAVAALVVTGCADPAKAISAAGYRNAVSLGARAELAQHGILLRERPACRSTGAENAGLGSDFTVECTASTPDNAAVTVHGVVTAAGTRAQREDYVIRLDGRMFLHADCLGVGCR
ncbi:hypothetical protein E1202_15930 [Saccharopolyspora karakumensis]|uniref:DUF4333 domain-containing protein n=1 Tax=Saccharopolyspora karakumensis TaxID=2530386 RepID=A0A4R5BU90_9PSEU|nr:hypothetical protein [Saccharopolyspora karakumensis]TDD87782.1 hypothetical protein E1202_15930 [Saccharopolyspora karakumensis]